MDGNVKSAVFGNHEIMDKMTTRVAAVAILIGLLGCVEAPLLGRKRRSKIAPIPEDGESVHSKLAPCCSC